MYPFAGMSEREIIPSLLVPTAQLWCLRYEQLQAAGTQWAHYDLTDGQFVEAPTVQPADLTEFLTSVDKPLNLEVHLMVQQPLAYREAVQALRVRRVLFHREVCADLAEVARTAAAYKEMGCEVGLVYNPETPVDALGELPLDVVQCMGVHPGASGQPLLPSVYTALKEVRAQRLRAVSAVDGGVNEENLPHLKAAGARRFVIASAIFTAEPNISLTDRLRQFTHLVEVDPL